MKAEVVNFLSGQGITLSDEHLAHYGKVGMKWGQRRSDTDGDGLVDGGVAAGAGGGGEFEDEINGLTDEDKEALQEALKDGAQIDRKDGKLGYKILNGTKDAEKAGKALSNGYTVGRKDGQFFIYAEKNSNGGLKTAIREQRLQEKTKELLDRAASRKG